MPNRSSKTARKTSEELFQRGMTAPGKDPLPVRIQVGAVTYAVPGYSFAQTKVGSSDDAALSPTAPENVERVPTWFDARSFSAIRLYLSFEDNAGAPMPFANESVATVEVYGACDNGQVVLLGTISDLGHRVEQRVETVGRVLFFRLAGITLSTATRIVLHAAGEGTGYEE